MERPEQIISLIEAFKSAELEKSKAIEMAGITEEEFDQQVKLYESGLDAIELGALKAELKTIHEEFAEEDVDDKTTTRLSGRIWYMAASVIAIGAFVWLLTTSGAETKTFDDLYKPYPNLVSMRGDEEKDMTEAMRLYSSRQYAEALNVFNGFSPDTLENEYYFYRGICFMALDSFARAERSFLTIGVSPTNPYWQQTKWYLALTYWQLENNAEAISLLSSIESDQYEYENSQLLLEQLSE